MDEQLTNYVNGVFSPYDGVKSATELKADLLSDLQERFRELKNVSFHLTSLWSTKRVMKSISLDGAMMDKLTYAALKGMGADVSKVTILS